MIYTCRIPTRDPYYGTIHSTAVRTGTNSTNCTQYDSSGGMSLIHGKNHLDNVRRHVESAATGALSSPAAEARWGKGGALAPPELVARGELAAVGA